MLHLNIILSTYILKGSFFFFLQRYIHHMLQNYIIWIKKWKLNFTCELDMIYVFNYMQTDPTVMVICNLEMMCYDL